jgi:hypothetical protein
MEPKVHYSVHKNHSVTEGKHLKQEQGVFFDANRCLLGAFYATLHTSLASMSVHWRYEIKFAKMAVSLHRIRVYYCFILLNPIHIENCSNKRRDL